MSRFLAFASIEEAKASGQWPLRHFKPHEVACSHTGRIFLDVHFGQFLDSLRDHLDRPVNVNSWYRAPSHPIEAKKAKPGAHTTGGGADLHLYGQAALIALAFALDHRIQRVGVNQKGPMKSRFIHFDMAPAFPAGIWSY